MSSPLRPGDKVLRARSDSGNDGRAHAEATVVDPSEVAADPRQPVDGPRSPAAERVSAAGTSPGMGGGSGSGWGDEATVDHRGGSSKRRAAPVSQALRARIAVIAGEDQGTELELSTPRTSIGRGLDNQVVLKDTSVSRRHVVIVAENGSFRIEDLDSGNGTLVNGDTIDRELLLEDGDELELGETVLKFTLVAPEGTPAGQALAEAALAEAALAEAEPAALPPVAVRPERRPARLTPTVLPIPSPPSRSIEIDTRLRKTSGWHKAALFGGITALALTLVGGLLTVIGGKRASDDNDPPRNPPADTHAVVEPGAPTPPGPTALPATPGGGPAAAIDPQLATPTHPEPHVTPLPAAPKKPNPHAAPQLGAEKTAFGLYRDKKFEEAVQTLRDAADSDPDDTDRLSAEAHDYAAVGAGYARGAAESEENPASAMVAFEDALGADRRSGHGAHATELRAHLAQVTPRASVAYLAANRYEEARAACDLAASLGAQHDAQVLKVRAQLETIARDLYESGVKLEASNREQAHTLFRRVLKIVPASSGWYTKA